MSFKQAVKGQDGPDVGETRIVVDGPGTLGYDEVKTANIDIWLRLTLNKIVDPSREQILDTIEIRGEGERIAAEKTFGTRRYKLSFPYADPHSGCVANQRNSVIDICNKRLGSLSGAARTDFLRKGADIFVNAAYPVVAEGIAEWSTSGGGTFKEWKHHSKTYEETVQADAIVECRPLDRPRPRTQTSTQGANPKPGKPLPPVISLATLRASPAQNVVVSNQLCPSQLRLYGRVQAARAFSGKAVIFGPGYFSPVTPLEYTQGGNRNFTAVYPLKWDQPARLATGNNVPLKTQTVDLTMNVVNKDDNTPPLTAKPKQPVGGAVGEKAAENNEDASSGRIGVFS